jgi:hypothetical protein
VRPLGDETRVGLVFSTLLHNLISQAFDRATLIHGGLPPARVRARWHPPSRYVIGTVKNMAVVVVRFKFYGGGRAT